MPSLCVYLPSLFCVCVLSPAPIYSTSLLSPACFSSLLLLSALDSASPHTPPFLAPFLPSNLLVFSLSPPFSLCFPLSFSRSSCESHQRNTARCRLDERGHTGPAELVVLSHHLSLFRSPPLPLSLSPSVTCTHEVGPGQISATARSLALSRRADVKGFLRTVVKLVPPYQPQTGKEASSSSFKTPPDNSIKTLCHCF